MTPKLKPQGDNECTACWGTGYETNYSMNACDVEKCIYCEGKGFIDEVDLQEVI